MKTKDLAISSLFIALISISAQISIQIPIVPFTLQLLTISLCGLLLSQKQATYAIIGYIVIGLIGLPVFSGYQGGFTTIMKPTFGFILGFIPFILVIKKNPVLAWLSLYLTALPILYINLKYLLNVDVNVLSLIKLYCLTFIPTDFISITLAKYIHKKMRR